MRVGNVIIIVIVQSRSYNVLIELALNVPRSTVITGLVGREVYFRKLDNDLKFLFFSFEESKAVFDMCSGDC